MAGSLHIRGTLAQNGTVRGRSFLHAGLRFRYEFPNAWRIWKGTDDVVGLSSAQDAIIRLRIFPGTPDEAASTFFRELETESGPIARDSINGLSALTCGFLVDTGNWAVRGLATFLSYDSRTYEMTGSATSDVFEHYRVDLRESLESFDRLSSAGDSAAAMVRGVRENPAWRARRPR